jgi:hypothetical protein
LGEGQRAERRRRCQGVEDIIGGDLQMRGDFIHRWAPAQWTREVADSATDVGLGVLKPSRHSNRSQAIAKVPADLTENRWRRKGRERCSPRGVESIDGLDEPDHRDLLQVVERLPSARIAPREGTRKRHVREHLPFALLFRERSMVRGRGLVQGMLVIGLISKERCLSDSLSSTSVNLGSVGQPDVSTLGATGIQAAIGTGPARAAAVAHVG